MSTEGPTGGLYLIGVVAQMAGVHPQTLRLYERRGLLTPGRSAGKTRRYSDADLAVLRRIQSLSERGLNLAGIERVLELERQLVEAQAQVSVLAQQLDGERRAHRDALVQAHRSTRAEMVLVRPSETALVPLVRPVTQNRRR